MSVIRFSRYIRAGLGVRRSLILAFNTSVEYTAKLAILGLVILVLATAFVFK